MVLRITCIGSVLLQVLNRWFYIRDFYKDREQIGISFFMAKLSFTVWISASSSILSVFRLKLYFITYDNSMSVSKITIALHIQKHLKMYNNLFVNLFCMNFLDNYSWIWLQEFPWLRSRARFFAELFCRLPENGLFYMWHLVLCWMKSICSLIGQWNNIINWKIHIFYMRRFLIFLHLDYLEEDF